MKEELNAQGDVKQRDVGKYPTGKCNYTDEISRNREIGEAWEPHLLLLIAEALGRRAVNNGVLESYSIIPLDNRINALASGTIIDISTERSLCRNQTTSHQLVPNKHADASPAAMVGYPWMVMYA
jgi:hypothetical protein